MKRIIYSTSDGMLHVVLPNINTHPTPENITEDQALDRAYKALPADAISPQIIEESALPRDRTFRNAWKAGTGCIDHDMGKCRAIWRDNLRKLRAPKFTCLDVEYMKALEAGDSAQCAAIAAQKQALRDVPADPAIDAAATPDELKAVIPAALKSALAEAQSVETSSV